MITEFLRGLRGSPATDGRIRREALLLHQVEPVPISAEVLHLARGQLEPGTQLPVLEEYVRVSQARGVQILPLPLLGEDPLDALDEADLFQDPNLAVTCRYRGAISLADFLCTDFPLVCGEENLRAVFIRKKLGRFQR